jgi:hypothetical protein
MLGFNEHADCLMAAGGTGTHERLASRLAPSTCTSRRPVGRIDGLSYM